MTGGRWRDIVLVISVVLNVFVVGAVVGAGARGGFSREPAHGAPNSGGGGLFRPGFSPMQFIRALPPRERRAAQRRVRREAQDMAPLMREAAAARADATSIFLADTLDVEAALEALERSRNAEARIRSRSEALVVEILASLPPEERIRALRAARGQHGGRVRGRDRQFDRDRPLDTEGVDPPVDD